MTERNPAFLTAPVQLNEAAEPLCFAWKVKVKMKMMKVNCENESESESFSNSSSAVERRGGTALFCLQM